MNKWVIIILFVNIAVAYDATIEDKYGKTIGYQRNTEEGYEVLNKYGRKISTVEYTKEGSIILDKYGRKQYTIKDEK